MRSMYDLNDLSLARALHSKFRTEGFVFLPCFLKQPEVELLNFKIAEFIQNKLHQMPTEQIYYEDPSDKSTLKQLQELFKYDPFFETLIFGSEFEKLATILLNENVVGKNIQYFNKPPGIGLPTPAHQDGFYFKLVPNEALTMWLALEKVDEENGCVRYIKGSHLKGMRPHQKTGVLGFSQGITNFGWESDISNEVFYPTEPGDLLIHHSLTIHRADGNKSKTRTRKALGLIYYSKTATQDEAAHQAYQKQLSVELKQTNKI